MPDWRYGIDNNMPTEGLKAGDATRVWRTDLHTGRTDDHGFLEGYGPVWPNGSDANFTFGRTGDVTGGGTSTWGIALDMPFYTWASVIVNGRAVATDYAPDAGWLIATLGAKPGGTFLLDDPFPIGLSMSVPDGWTANGPWLEHAGTSDDQYGRLEFLLVDADHPPTWGCEASGDGIQAQFGPTVDDLVAYLVGQPTIKISENADVTLDGFRGTYLEFTNATTANCGVVPSSTRAWIVDVDGVRLVIGASVERSALRIWRFPVRRRACEQLLIEGIAYTRARADIAQR